MQRLKRLIVLAVGVGGLVLMVVFVRAALAHGSMMTPVSRTYQCFQEGPETPRSAACRDAIAIGGTQALYDWNEVNIGDAAGRHRELIPDGKLCSAGRAKYQGFDQARTDWPATELTSGRDYTFFYRATAPHRGTFDLYITRDGYNGTQALKWSDLEANPFLSVTNPALINGSYVMAGRLPVKQGRHVIYAIWQRSDSPEAFYACSDVVFGGGGNPTTTPNPSPTPSPSPTPKPSATPSPTSVATPTPSPTPVVGVQPWAPYTAYTSGALVTYSGRTYRCWQSHTSLPGWEPPAVPALWQVVQ